MPRLSGAFGSGFTQGFGTTLAEGIQQRDREREKYIDISLDNARRAAPAYAQSEAEISAIEDYMKQMNDDFDITTEEFVALTQNYDIHEIYKNVYTAKAVMEKNNIRGQIDKSMILGSLSLPENFKLPEDMTGEQALRAIFQGVTKYTDPRNKSEQHRAGAFGKAVADLLSLNPRLSAEEQIKGMRIAGVDVERLLGFQASGGAKQTPFSQLKASGPFQNIEVDYTDKQYSTTLNAFAKIFSGKFTGIDDPESYAELLQRNTEAINAFGENATTTKIKQEIYAFGQEFANLEKSLIGRGLDVGFGQANARYQVMSGLVTRFADGKAGVNEVRDFITMFRKDSSIVDRIVEAYRNDQYITDKEFEKIMSYAESTTTTQDTTTQDTTTQDTTTQDTTTTTQDTTTSPITVPRIEKPGSTTPEDLIARNDESASDRDETDTTSSYAPNEMEQLFRNDLGGPPRRRNVDVTIKEVEEAVQSDPDTNEMFIMYEDWNKMSKDGRKRLGLDLSKYAIQNMTRGGKILIDPSKINDVPDASMDAQSLGGQNAEDYIRQLVKDGVKLGKIDADYAARIEQELLDKAATKNASDTNSLGAGMMSPPSGPVDPESPSAPMIDQETPEYEIKLSDLTKDIKRLHGSSSKVARDFESLLEQEDPSYTKINKFIRETKKLPQTETRDKLLEKLYALANKAR